MSIFEGGTKAGRIGAREASDHVNTTRELRTRRMDAVQHLLSFVTNENGTMVSIHADFGGVSRLIEELEFLRDTLRKNDCPHVHLFSEDALGDSLSTTKLHNHPAEVNVVHHVKIYGWNDEWAVRHQLRLDDGGNSST